MKNNKMTGTEKYVPIEFISTYLQVRLQRVLYKVHKLELVLKDTNSLTKKDAITLVQSYHFSNMTSKDTKEKASILLTHIQEGKPLIKLKKALPKSVNKQFINRESTNDTWYKSFINEFINFIQALFCPVQDFVKYVIKGSAQILEGVHFKFVALIVAISVQMHHSAIWFQRVTPDENTSVYAAYGYAFMVDLFILVVTMEGKLSIAKTFASLTFLSNVLYFQFWVNFEYTAQAYTNAISSLLISGIMAYIIYAYTELFVKYRNSKAIITPH